MNRKAHLCTIAIMALLLGSCGGKREPPGPSQAMQNRPVEALPTRVYADSITVQQFRQVCDAMARHLVIQPLVARSPRPPVITIRSVQNKTGIDIDEKIFQETIRVKLMEHAGGSVLFRDDESYRDILEERVRQSSEEVDITLTDTRIKTRTVDRVKERDFQAGSLSSSAGQGQGTSTVEDEQQMDMQQSARVKSRLAPADYFLRGIIYQVKEIDATKPKTGMNYFQFQFRLTDARSGLIVWEKMMAYKMEGEYGVKPLSAQQGQGQGGQGTMPAGWPTGGVGQNATAPGGMPGGWPTGTQGGGQVPPGAAPGAGQAAPGSGPSRTLEQMNRIQKDMLPILEQINRMN